MLTAGQAVAHYEIEEVAGSGGMGVVYRARDVRLGRRVALKVIAPHLARDPIMRQRLNRESAVLAGLDHPNVLPLFEAGEADGVLFLASRWVEGRDLGDVVGEDGPLEREVAARVVGQVAAALAAAHRMGMVHRDVKPSNVLVAEDGHVYLSDFGIARRSSDVTGLTNEEQLLGTLDYVAPELIRGEDVDARADVYALGGLLHFALTGRVPFPRNGTPAKLYAHLSADPPSPSAAHPELGKDVDAVVHRAMAKDRDDRYQTAAEVQRDLQAIAAGRPVAAPPAPERSPDEPGPEPEPAPRPEFVVDTSPGAARSATAEAREAAVDATPPHPYDPPVRAGRAAVAAPVRAPAPKRLEPLPADEAAEPAAPRRRRGLWGLAAALVVLAALVPAALLLRATEDEAAGPRTVAVARGGSDLTIAAGRVWVAAPESSRVVGVPLADPAGRRRTIDVGDDVTALGARGDRLVVAAGRRLVTLPGADSRRAERLDVPLSPFHVAAGARTTWLASYQNEVLLTLRGRQAARTALSSATSDLALGYGALWVAHAVDGTVGSIDSSSGAPRRLDRVGGRPEGLALGPGAVWIADIERDAVLELDPRTGRTDAPIPVGGDPVAVAADDDEVWVARRAQDAVTRIDARTGRPIDEIGTAREPIAVALTPEAAYVLGRRGELTRIPRTG